MNNALKKIVMMQMVLLFALCADLQANGDEGEAVGGCRQSPTWNAYQENAKGN